MIKLLATLKIKSPKEIEKLVEKLAEKHLTKNLGRPVKVELENKTNSSA